MNQTYGRTIIKGSIKNKDYYFKRILTIFIICIIAGGLIGSLITWFIVQNKTEQYEQFGKIDERVFANEISFDWSSGKESGFIPLDVPLDEDTQKFIYCLAYGYNIDFSLVMAVIDTESSFNPKVISETDDYGLMQINKVNHQWLKDKLGITDFLDSKQNIRAGIFVLRKLFETNGNDTSKVLMAYNLGQSGAERFWNQGIYSTQYSEKVIKKQIEFQNKLKEGVQKQ